MGIAKGAAKILLKEASRRPFGGRVLTLGKQDIFLSYDLFSEISNEFGVKLCPVNVALSHKPAFAEKLLISDVCFIQSLGFSEVKSLDNSDYESADYVFDLNNNEVPEDLFQAFDVIIDGGTIEHVFHLPNALNNIFKMLRLGGRIIHLSPSSNHMDHGFYMFSPTLFWDFYTTNKFEVNYFELFRYTQRHDIDPWEISDYRPGCLGAIQFGGLDDGMYGIACIVTKTKDSTGRVIPQQGSYLTAWGISDQAKIEEGIETPQSYYLKLREYAKDTLKHFPFIYRAVRFIVNRILPQRKGLHLKIVARY